MLADEPYAKRYMVNRSGGNELPGRFFRLQVREGGEGAGLVGG